MDDAKQEIVDMVTAAGGEMSYKELYENVSFPTRAIIIDALTMLKRENAAEQVNTYHPKPPSVSHTVRLIVEGGE